MIDDPWHGMEAGDIRYFKTKTVKGGVFVAASIWIKDGDRDENGFLVSDLILGMTINGRDNTEFMDGLRQYPFFIPIEKLECEYLSALKAWADHNETSSPYATEQAVDFGAMRLPF